ncbi:PREDICTED: yrdC domain-containing protein, mitochondrial [Dufourea novaeangliae]|nr:PREDICTED: yrdC domain-containing protein, mitochondrial [Dufourea novaeangliae]
MIALQGATPELEELNSSKHWICKGKRSMSIAATLLQQNKVIAVPTDTVYGLAAAAMQTDAVRRLYEIKGRDENKPLCISVSKVTQVKHWGVVNHLHRNLLSTILPGPYTIILKRTPALNPDLNPGIDTVGIRVPNSKFINCVSHIIGPLALTSANVSNEPSCLRATEFEKLWPRIDGIFYDVKQVASVKETLRKGSTIVDLSSPNHYKIVRTGIGITYLISILRRFNLTEEKSD